MMSSWRNVFFCNYYFYGIPGFDEIDDLGLTIALIEENIKSFTELIGMTKSDIELSRIHFQ